MFVYSIALLALVSSSSSDAFVIPTATPSSTSLRSSHASLAPNTKDHDLDSDAFCVAVLGDLHIDPRYMEDYETGQDQWKKILEEQKACFAGDNVAVVSLGDLGESKSVRPDETNELFAGTTECHEIAAEFLGGFGVPYEVVGGNHDLEGIDEFDTDQGNLDMFLKTHGKPAPQFARQIADKTLLVGLTSTVFRDAQYTSHEVTIDKDQLQWFEDTIKAHPADDGWKVFVFTHAPPNGSGLRVLQENHVVNGCCWLNHSNDKECRKFIELVRENRCIKAWFSGHFHLGQDYQDSITFPTIDPKVGPYPNRGSCVFAQTSVMRKGTSRDTRQQSRFIKGTKNGFEICTVDHKAGGAVRVDAAISYKGDSHEVGVYAHEDVAYDHDNFFKVYQPNAGDDLHEADDGLIRFDDEMIMDKPVDKDTVAWWYMDSGRVLGMLNGNMIEYDPSTLAPLGLVVGADELINKRIAVIDSGEDGECVVEFDAEEGMEGADCSGVIREGREQAVLLIDDTSGTVTVVQPNEDGSYWRKIVRNKMVRMKEARRERAAKTLASALMKDKDATIISSWGPYTSTSGTAKKTGVKGLTTDVAVPNGASN